MAYMAVGSRQILYSDSVTPAQTSDVRQAPVPAEQPLRTESETRSIDNRADTRGESGNRVDVLA
ncbi:MAG: hypothetical protein K8S54_09900 [Spirochaetia bacterium]|nr:hypothetical protein [Spirochaetia bacterium]